MSAIFTMRNAVLVFMAGAVIFAAFAPVTPDAYAPYVKAAAGAATGLAALFMHPPTVAGDPPAVAGAATAPSTPIPLAAVKPPAA